MVISFQVVSTFDKNGLTFIEMIPVTSSVGDTIQTHIAYTEFVSSKRTDLVKEEKMDLKMRRILDNSVS